MTKEKTKHERGQILTEFEKHLLKGSFAEQYEIKRNNFFATIERFRPLWNCFMTLDEVFEREFETLQPISNIDHIFPKLFFVSCHRNYRLALELGFSCCFFQSCHLVRESIEAVYQASLLLKQPEKINIWLDKAQGSFPPLSVGFSSCFWFQGGRPPRRKRARSFLRSASIKAPMGLYRASIERVDFRGF